MFQNIAFVNPLSNTKLIYNDSSSLAERVTSEERKNNFQLVLLEDDMERKD